MHCKDLWPQSWNTYIEKQSRNGSVALYVDHAEEIGELALSRAHEEEPEMEEIHGSVPKVTRLTQSGLNTVSESLAITDVHLKAGLLDHGKKQSWLFWSILRWQLFNAIAHWLWKYHAVTEILKDPVFLIVNFLES